MKLESQVCSLELAKRLKELGVKQESLFWYSINPRPKSERTETELEAYLTNGWEEDNYGFRRGENVSCFTVAELGAFLRLQYPESRLYKEWPLAMIWDLDETEAEARAKMLILLLETTGGAS